MQQYIPISHENAYADLFSAQWMISDSSQRGKGRGKGRTNFNNAARAIKYQELANGLSALIETQTLDEMTTPTYTLLTPKEVHSY